MPKYGNSAPGSQKWNFSKIFHFCGKFSRFRFKRALNHPQTISLSQVMQKNILSKKLNLGLNFSTPSGGVTSPSLKGSMVQAHKLSQMDIQPGGVQDHFLQNVLKFGFGDRKMCMKRGGPTPSFPKISRKLDVCMGKVEKKYMKREENKYLF